MTGSSAFPAPHIILPTSSHSHSIILLHGRGSNGFEFAEELSEARTSSGRSLPEHFPSWKWIFPTSQERYSSVFQENMNEWFDIYSLSNPSCRQELQVEGLRQSVAFLQSFIRDEARFIPPSRLILSGISQGCATSIRALLASSYKLGAYLGFCGWMPFKAQIRDIIKEAPASQIKSRLVKFSQSSLDLGCPAPATTESAETVFDAPVFLSHAANDDVIDVDLGREMCKDLEGLGMSVTWKEYEVGGHWVKEPEGFDDIVAFLKGVELQD